jgi:hypothetical protein
VFYRSTAGEYRLQQEDTDSQRRRDAVLAGAAKQQRYLESRQKMLSGLPVQIENVSTEILERTRQFHADHAISKSLDTVETVPASDEERSLPVDALDIQDRSYFFQASDGSVLALLTLEIRLASAGRDASSDPTVPGRCAASAWVVEIDTGAAALRPAFARRVDLAPLPNNVRPDRLFFTGRVLLEPGLYEIRYAVEDQRTQQLAIRRDILDVPDLPLGEFSASSVVPAERFGPRQETSPSWWEVGSEEVVPRPAGAFRRGEPVRVYLQFYGAALDPRRNKPRVDVTFRFERLVAARYRLQDRERSASGVEGASLGLALPARGWPSGRYRVVVDLRDRVTGLRTSTEGVFTIVD